MTENLDALMGAAVKRQQAESTTHRKTLQAFFNRKDSFLVNSMEDWLQIARQVPEIRIVPTIMLEPRIPVEDLMRTAANGEEPSLALAEAARKIKAQFEGSQNHILRFDPCIADDIKFRVNEGQHSTLAPGPELQDPIAMLTNTMRALEIIATDYPRSEMPVFMREWIRPAMVRDYPLEFRTWVLNDSVQAVCNYYPQRALTETEWDNLPVEKILQWTHALAGHTPADLRPDIQNPEIIAKVFTADWILAEDGTLYWLECGPGSHMGGAHPCCFENEMEALDPETPRGKIRERWSPAPEDVRQSREPF